MRSRCRRPAMRHRDARRDAAIARGARAVVRVARTHVDDQRQQLVDLGLEGEGFGVFAHGAFEKRARRCDATGACRFRAFSAVARARETLSLNTGARSVSRCVWRRTVCSRAFRRNPARRFAAGGARATALSRATAARERPSSSSRARPRRVVALDGARSPSSRGTGARIIGAHGWK